MQEAYVGIDVCFAKRKRLPISICTWENGRLMPKALRRLDAAPPRGHGNAATLNAGSVQQFADDAARYIRQVCTELDLAPARIAIDAPSSPRREGQPRRAAERAMDLAKISCFTTPTASEFTAIKRKVRAHLAAGGPENRIPHANQLWMLVGFALFEALDSVAECLEVFPQAIVRALGAGDLHKFKSGAVGAQLAAAAAHTGWPRGIDDEPTLHEIAWAPGHDSLDAYLSAWVAALDEPDRIAFGKPPNDVIWVPKVEAGLSPVNLESVLPVKRPKPRTRPGKRPARSAAAQPRQCPACDFQFRRWPFGWDAHAAHRCTGLTEAGKEARKREFKRRYGELFKA